VRRIATRGRPWGVVSSGSILCYSTSRGLVFHDFVRDEQLAEIATTHHCAALALGPRGELVVADEDGDALYVYEHRPTNPPAENEVGRAPSKLTVPHDQALAATAYVPLSRGAAR